LTQFLLLQTYENLRGNLRIEKYSLIYFNFKEENIIRPSFNPEATRCLFLLALNELLTTTGISIM